VEIYDVRICFYLQRKYYFLFLSYQFGEERTIHLFSDIIGIILQVQFFVCAIENSKVSSEQKFYENITKITDETLRLNLENQL